VQEGPNSPHTSIGGRQLEVSLNTFELPMHVSLLKCTLRRDQCIECGRLRNLMVCLIRVCRTTTGRNGW
jgi:hypothetical protein